MPIQVRRNRSFLQLATGITAEVGSGTEWYCGYGGKSSGAKDKRVSKCRNSQPRLVPQPDSCLHNLI